MSWRNTKQQYGWIAISLHWLTAIAVFGLFGLGLYMTSLTYYDPFYRTGPEIHKSIGLLLVAVIVGRLLWRSVNPAPQLPSHSPVWERLVAHLTHAVLYVLLLAICFSGYLISTAKGQGIDVFGWFTVPALPWQFEQQATIAGNLHYWLAWGLIVLVGLHALAALKHHFYDKDVVLRRMLGFKTPHKDVL